MNKSNHKITRRQFLCNTASIALAVSLPETLYAAVVPAHKELSLYNLHTEEKLTLRYFEHGAYVTGALREISYLLRDHRTGDVLAMDPKLIDLLYDLKGALGTNQPIQVISGYRSPKTNALLHRRSQGVAMKSLHMQGKAIDIRISGISSTIISKAAMSLARGGVGYYPSSGFVHVDTGLVRAWAGH